MIEIDNAIAFVERHGTSIEVARLESIMGIKYDNDKVLQKIKEMQNNDGGYGLNNNKSCLSDTGFVLTWLSDLKLDRSILFTSAIEYLESEQNIDGSWNEKINDEKDVPEWQESKSHKAILYQTTNTMFWLIRYSRNKKCIEMGLRYLSGNYDSRIEYIHTKWLYASILSSVFSWKNENIEKIMNEIYREISIDVPSSMKTWMLWSFSLYGIEYYNNYLQEIIKGIKQDKNGSIDSEDDDSYRVNATLELIKVYKYYLEGNKDSRSAS